MAEQLEQSPILSVTKLTKSFGANSRDALLVLDQLSFELYRGQVVAFLGASGCGKSTLLRIMAGLEQPSSGEVRSQMARPGREVGFLYQGERLLPWRTAVENAALGLEFLGVGKRAAESLADTELSRLGLADFRDAFPAALSGGMVQRVLMARTFVTRPKIVFLDEPLGQLDLVARKELGSYIREYVHDHSATVVLVTHSVEEALFVSDRIFTLTKRPAKLVDHFAVTERAYTAEAMILGEDNRYERVVNSLLHAIGDDSCESVR